MGLLTEEKISCPYCGELIEVLVEALDLAQEYIEDCQVCCRPISFVVAVDMAGDLSISVHAENDTF